MRLLWIAVLVACGGQQPAPAEPVSNASHEEPASPEPAVTIPIKMDRDGGVIEVRGNRAIAQDSVRNYMVQRCGQRPFTIVRQGEEVVTATKESVITAWRVHFQCNP